MQSYRLIEERCRRAGVIPVLAIAEAADAVPLCRALVDGGLDVLEITLRTPAAWEAATAVAKAIPEATVGVGTVRDVPALEQAKKLGLAFAVSPGFTPAMLERAVELDLPYLPGTVTPAEIMTAAAKGYTFLKFFPAELSGGTGMLKALASPLAGLSFCPTGGVKPANLQEYLRLPNVACVGGTWLAGAEDQKAKEWAAVARKAHEAAALRDALRTAA
jgi:2-dehydro-3-deoxyphosphogluconate aldolase/(4S)-4-hydroxy-2-oxoglutarate aldolase